LLQKDNRNAPLLGVLAALTVCDGAFHWAVGHGNAPLAGRVLIVAIDIVLARRSVSAVRPV